FLEFAKGPRHGERYRHEVLQSARGDVVCYLGDDDLWLPSHVETMCLLAKQADFVHTLPLIVQPDGRLTGWALAFLRPVVPEIFLKGTNPIPLCCGAHTMALYRKLPHGWRTTPEGIATDFYMWQQILGVDGCRVASSPRPTVLNFPSPF